MHDLAAPNKEFNITAKEFKKKYKSGDRIYEYTFNTSNPRIIPEPDNPYDPNALRVMVGNTKIGYIKKGSCSRVKNTLNNPNYSHCSIRITGGRYKGYDLTDDGDLRFVTDKSGMYAKLTLYLSDSSVKKKNHVKPSSDEDKKKQVLGYIAMFLILLMILVLIFGR